MASWLTSRVRTSLQVCQIIIYIHTDIVYNSNMNTDKESLRVLKECAELQLKKSNDYQNPQSRIRQSDYYPSGVKTILEIIYAKVLRAQSVIEAMELDPSYEPNFESVEDSFKDMINYASFAVSFIRGGVDGQDPNRDFLNRVKPLDTED
jgi:hypothetical protein